MTKREGVTYYSGEHTKGQEDGKWVTFKDYAKEFHDYIVSNQHHIHNIIATSFAILIYT